MFRVRGEIPFRAGLRTLAAALGIVVSLICKPAAADDNYKEMTLSPLAQTPGKITTLDESRAVIGMLNGEQPLNAEEFDKFFNEIVFPVMTLSHDRTVGRTTISPLVDRTWAPATLRTAFKNNYVNKATVPAARERLNARVLDVMDKVAAENYHPVVRYNAMMMIADLNEVNGQPCKKALNVLLSSATGKNSADVVRVAALRGLVRHARDEHGIDPEVRPNVVNGMLGILQQHAAPPERGQDGHNWILRRAIDVLAAMGEGGTGGAVPKAMIDLVGDPAVSLDVRCAAAAGLAKVTKPGTPLPAGVSVTDLAKNLGKLAVDSYKADLAAAEASRSSIVIDRLKQHLAEIRTGLVGSDGKGGVLALSTAAAQQQFVAALAKQIEAVATSGGSIAISSPAFVPGGAGVGIGGATPMIPVDTQAKIADAISKAGAILDALVQKGEAGGAPAAAAAPAAAEAGGFGA